MKPICGDCNKEMRLSELREDVYVCDCEAWKNININELPTFNEIQLMMLKNYELNTGTA